MVVVIEEQPEQISTPKTNTNTYIKIEPSISSKQQEHDVAEEESAETSSVISNKDVSDGFETASDGGAGDDDGETPGEQGEERSSGGAGGDGGFENTPAVVVDDSYQDALNDHQLFQKALALANDAKVEGNELFKDGKFEDALLKYESALQVAPEIPKPEPAPQALPKIPKPESSVPVASETPPSQSAPQDALEKPKNESAQLEAPEMTALKEIRSICHSNRAVCLLKLGKYDETVKECSKALDLNPTYVKALRRRGEAYEKLERYEEAIKDMKKILELDPSDIEAKRNIVRLEPLAHEKMEKMKDEMIGKLKDLGNNVLGRFGMSVDNFKAVKDPNTGSYSISFQR